MINTFIATRFHTGGVPDPTTPLVMGNSRRRLIQFCVKNPGSVNQFDIAPMNGLLEAMFQLEINQTMLTVDYKTYGDLVCQPWYYNSSGTFVLTCILEVILQV